MSESDASRPSLDPCTSCRAPSPAAKPHGICGLCDSAVCKRCTLFVAPEDYRYLPESEVPETLSFGRYCPGCHAEFVAPILDEYAATLARAKEVIVLSAAYDGHVPVIKKAHRPYEISGESDRDELILRMAFWAARADYNAIIEVETKRAQVRNEGYQTSAWSGKSFGANVDEARLRRNEYQDEVWRRGN